MKSDQKLSSKVVDETTELSFYLPLCFVKQEEVKIREQVGIFFFKPRSFEVDLRESVCASDHCVTRVDQWLLRLDLAVNAKKRNGCWVGTF